jgi:hypothetical protein
VIDFLFQMLLRNGILYHFIPYDQIVIDSRHCHRFCLYMQKVLPLDTNCFLDTFYAPNSIIICMTVTIYCRNFNWLCDYIKCNPVRVLYQNL